MTNLLARLRALLRLGRLDDELAEELEWHRARRQAQFEAEGMSPRDAARASRRAMGNVALAREDARAAWVPAAVERVWRDIRHGARGLRREPTFAGAAILTLALGIATLTVVFSIVDAELWRPLPFPDAGRLVVVDARRVAPNTRYEPVSLDEYLALGTRVGAFAALGASGERTRQVLKRDYADNVSVLPVSRTFLEVLGVVPALGRGFDARDRQGGRVAILGHAAWRRLFDGDPAIVGREVVVGDAHLTIVGVLGPRRFEYMTEPDLFVAIDETVADSRERTARVLDLVGRVRAGVPLPAAEAETRAAVQALDGHDGGRDVHLVDLRQFYTGFNWRPLYFLLGAAAIVLVLSCLNVANLLVARALRRGPEFAIRGALGGGRVALTGQLVVEGALIAVPGAATALLLSTWALGALETRLPAEYLVRDGAAIDLRVFAFAAVLAVVVALVFGLAPVRAARRTDLNLLHGARLHGGGGGRRTRHALVIAEVTITLVLVAGAATFLRSFAAVSRVPLGFEPAGRFVVRVPLPGARYADPAARRAFGARLLESARAVPGVRTAALASSSPLGSAPIASMRDPADPSHEPGRALVRSVTPGYFDTLGIRRLAGRAFTEQDVPGSPPVAIVDEQLAAALFAGDAIGRVLEIAPRGARSWIPHAQVVIVGVVGDAKDVGLNEVPFNNVYLPFAQAPPAPVELIAAAPGTTAGIPARIHEGAARADPWLPVSRISTFDERVDLALQEDRFHLLLIAAFACVGLVVAAIGIYGTMAYAAEQRRREYGIRLALGASPSAVLRSGLAQSIALGGAGVAAGVVVIAVLSRVLGSALYLVPGEHNGLLYGVSLTDPPALAAAAIAVLSIAALAGAWPARRAARLDPVSVLRADA